MFIQLWIFFFFFKCEWGLETEKRQKDTVLYNYGKRNVALIHTQNSFTHTVNILDKYTTQLVHIDLCQEIYFIVI